MAEGSGTRLTVRHGPYDSSAEDVEERESHAAGRLHFPGTLYLQPATIDSQDGAA